MSYYTPLIFTPSLNLEVLVQYISKFISPIGVGKGVCGPHAAHDNPKACFPENTRIREKEMLISLFESISHPLTEVSENIIRNEAESKIPFSDKIQSGKWPKEKHFTRHATSLNLLYPSVNR